MTPAEGGALGVLEAMLVPIGFTVDRPTFAEHGTPDVENLYARLGRSGPHLMFAGHTDVVPPGDDGAWTHPPFAAEIADGEMFGRGAVDMKGGIACFVAALARYLEANPQADPVGLAAHHRRRGGAGDQRHGEAAGMGGGSAANAGTRASSASRPTLIALGDMVKIGRRGSLSGAPHGQGPARAMPPIRISPTIRCAA